MLFGVRMIHPSYLIAPFCLFAAFVLLLLVSLSLPIIKPIYFLEISSNRNNSADTTLATAVEIGIWGYCFRNRNRGPFSNNYVGCSKPQVGYTIDPILLRVFGNANLANVLKKALVVFLVIHPVACGLTFLTVTPSILRAYRIKTPHAVSILTLLVAIIPTVLTTIVFMLDIALVLIARSRVHEATQGGLGVHWGPAVWMTAAAAVLLWIGVIGLSAVACGCCGCGWKEKPCQKDSEMKEYTPDEAPSRR